MKDGIAVESIIGLFENVFENDEKTSDLKSQVKAITVDTNDQFKDFAKDAEMKVKDLKQGYKYWKDRKDSGEGDDEENDFFNIVAMLDSYFEKEEEEDKEKEN